MSPLLSRWVWQLPAGLGSLLGCIRARHQCQGLRGFTTCPTTPCPISWGALPAADPCPVLPKAQDEVMRIC